jgi:hypothetical protein
MDAANGLSWIPGSPSDDSAVSVRRHRFDGRLPTGPPKSTDTAERRSTLRDLFGFAGWSVVDRAPVCGHLG